MQNLTQKQLKGSFKKTIIAKFLFNNLISIIDYFFNYIF